MNKMITGVAAVALTSAALPLGLGLLSGGSASASPTPTHAAAVSNQDAVFLKANDQTDLAEITIGKIALQRARHNDTKMMAMMTIKQHTAALAAVRKLAKNYSVTLPAQPNPTQRAQAAQLKTVAAGKFDLTYDVDQVSGHLISIAGTSTEIATGKNTAVISFAEYYLPIAEQHLNMALKDLAALEGK
jgi:putative membrane protein